MPRANRIDIANGLHHVTQRGLEQRNIVLNDDDRSHWWRLFTEVAQRCRWRVFAVALLDNHYHIYLRTPDPNLSEGMRDLNGGYAAAFNQRHERAGPLYQGRFKSVLVENDSHSWELSRYVHLNPYRAGLTRDPFHYNWSSYSYYLDNRRVPAWLDSRTVLAEFAGTEAAARVAYKRLVEAGMHTPPQNPLQAAEETGILGTPEFIKHCQEWLTPLETTPPTLDDILQAVCTEFTTTIPDVTRRGQHNHTARNAAILLARDFLTESLENLALIFGGVSRSSITETAKRARSQEQTNATFRAQLATLRNNWRQT